MTYLVTPCACGECGQCLRFGRFWSLTRVQQVQYDRLLFEDLCFPSGPRLLTHRLVLVRTRRWRDGFRRRVWWMCSFCDLCEEQTR